MSKKVEQKLLTAIVALFILLSTTYSVVVPPFEASDELWHYPMVKHIADHWSLPVQDPANVGPWRQEGSQPPLYYIVGALATCWIDTSDMEQVRHLNPRVDNGIASPDGNVNLVVHQPHRGRFPWQGTVLAVHTVRLLSVLMGAAAVVMTYLIVREVLPGEPTLALGAAAIHAFTPMYVFISGSVNNDNLTVALCSLALLMLIRMANERDFGEFSRAVSESESERMSETSASSVEPSANQRGLKWKTPLVRYLLLGIVLGLAALTKSSSLALTVLTALVVSIRAVRRRSWGEFLLGGFATLLPLLAIAGWWYLRNLRLYGDLSGLNTFIEILGQRDVPADAAQLWRERFSFLAGYWGNFGGFNVPMAGWAYTVLNVVLVIAALGLLLTLLRSLVSLLSSVPLAPGSFASPCRTPLLLCLLWGLGVLIPWAQWARVTWSSQGRLIFPAISTWSLLLALGLAGWLPRRWRRWALAALALFLLSLSAMAPFVWIRPAYASPTELTDAQIAAIPHRTNTDFDDVMRLLGYDLETKVTKPGGQVAVTLYWEALAPAERDYVVFVHLLGEHERLIAQRDTFPGLGLLSTTWLDPGFAWADRYVIPLPETAYAPDEAQIEVGLYDAETGVRLSAVGADGEQLGDNVRFGKTEIRSPQSPIPNPLSINFGDRMLLTGYDLTRLAARPGETITLTLHWQALRSMDNNYTVSAQLVDRSQSKAAQHDSWPLDGDAPTAAWKPEQVVVDEIPLTIFPEASPGPYDLWIAVYVQREGEIVHLPITPEGGRMQSNHIVLTPVMVTPRP